MSTNTTCFASTSSGVREFSLEIAAIHPYQSEGYIDKKRLDNLCETGCPNFKRKWSCPPYAPTFSEFICGWDTLFVFNMRINMAQFSHINNDYLKIKAANTILKSRADRFLRQMAKKYGRYISTGSCRLCKPCKCKNGIPCAHPELMTYSFEAMGVDVGALINEFFQKPLLWYEPNCLPEYTSVVCGLLTSAKITAEELIAEYANIIAN